VHEFRNQFDPAEAPEVHEFRNQFAHAEDPEGVDVRRPRDPSEALIEPCWGPSCAWGPWVWLRRVLDWVVGCRHSQWNLPNL
jgi:hypothetical protein